MEKRKPHCALSVVKALIQEGKVRATKSATDSAADLGIFGIEAMSAVVLSLATKDFYKSMTTNADTKVWQDVYHAQTDVGELYVKLTVIDDVLIVSFKPL